MLHWSVLCDVALITVLHDVADTRQPLMHLPGRVLDIVWLPLCWESVTDTQRISWSLRKDRWVECHDWHTENMGTEDRQVGWVPWLTHREHGYWGWTGGLSVTTDIQRTWVLRVDRWVECHDWHRMNRWTCGVSVMTDTQRTWVLRMDRWVECRDRHQECRDTHQGCHDIHPENLTVNVRVSLWQPPSMSREKPKNSMVTVEVQVDWESCARISDGHTRGCHSHLGRTVGLSVKLGQ